MVANVEVEGVRRRKEVIRCYVERYVIKTSPSKQYYERLLAKGTLQLNCILQNGNKMVVVTNEVTVNVITLK